MAKELPIDSRIVHQLAKATVRNVVDGIVELITNSDDSYRRIEQQGHQISGAIEIYVDRKKGSICRNLKVKDFAEGMTSEELEEAIVFGAETSGFEVGKSVRGLFGRGLKETIIALGEGEIRTVKDGRLCRTRLWCDPATDKPQYDDEMLGHSPPVDERNGTEIDIKVTNEKIRIPDYKTFKPQVSNHYALRDINSSERREITLIFQDRRRKLTRKTPITFAHPEGKRVLKTQVLLPEFGDRVRIAIYQSSKALESPKNNPYGLAGILIKTNGAILDNKLFRFENDPAAHYFYGEAISDGLEDRLRAGETGIVDPNRGGLEWRHEYCQALSTTIEEVLEPLVLEKRQGLERRPARQVNESTKKMLKRLCRLLNGLAEGELEDISEVPTDPEPDITTLLVKPEVANIPMGQTRIFSIYAPLDIIRSEGREARVTSDTAHIRPLSSTVKLERHRKFGSQIWYKYLSVVGITEGAEGTLTAQLGTQIAFARVRVAPLKKSRKRKITGRKRGFISDILPDELVDPPQRVVYRDGIIRIYTRFPSVSDFISGGLKGAETPEGRLLLAELVGEAFCRELARQGTELGKYPTVPGNEVDSFNTVMNELQKKYLHQIQGIVFRWRF